VGRAQLFSSSLSRKASTMLPATTKRYNAKCLVGPQGKTTCRCSRILCAGLALTFLFHLALPLRLFKRCGHASFNSVPNLWPDALELSGAVRLLLESRIRRQHVQALRTPIATAPGRKTSVRTIHFPTLPSSIIRFGRSNSIR
jgi:hypothetical protein